MHKIPRQTFLLALIVFALTFPGLTACGKRRPPLPPVERIPQRTEALSGVQQGNQVILSWPALLTNASDASLQSIRRIDIYRLAEAAAAPLALTEEEFGARATLIGSVDYEQIRTARDDINYVDKLEFAGTDRRLRYALRYVNSANQRAAFSNYLLIQPAALVASAPQLQKVDYNEKTVTLDWTASTTNLDGSTPVNLLGYNIYRFTTGELNANTPPLNAAPVIGIQYSDQTFEFGTKYYYLVRAVSLGAEAAQVESLNSNTVELLPTDKFPPSAPTAISIAPANQANSLFFPANPEADVAEYQIYRSTDRTLNVEKWELISPANFNRTTFRDDKTVGGTRYYYYLRAVDAAGNISPPSEIVSEVAP